MSLAPAPLSNQHMKQGSMDGLLDDRPNHQQRQQQQQQQLQQMQQQGSSWSPPYLNNKLVKNIIIFAARIAYRYFLFILILRLF